MAMLCFVFRSTK